MPRSIAHGSMIACVIVVFFTYLTLRPFLMQKKYTQVEEWLAAQQSSYEKKGSHTLWDHVEFCKNSKELLRYRLESTFITDQSPSFISQLKLAFYWKFYAQAVIFLGKRHLSTLLTLIENYPTDLKAHTEYARAIMHQIALLKIPTEWSSYFLASTLKSIEGEEHKKKLEKLYLLAIEELKIIDSLSPRDAWTHAQLADCYREIHQPDLELQTVELLKQLRPQDKEILFQLGQLYFCQTHYFEGIKIYDSLKNIDKDLAKKLMNFFKHHHESHFM
jgi:tetratricopeptide (TPR) repeat protein